MIQVTDLPQARFDQIVVATDVKRHFTILIGTVSGIGPSITIVIDVLIALVGQVGDNIGIVVGLNALGNNLLRPDLVNNHGGVVPGDVPALVIVVGAVSTADVAQLLAFILLAVDAFRKLEGNPCILLGVGI